MGIVLVILFLFIMLVVMGMIDRWFDKWTRGR